MASTSSRRDASESTPMSFLSGTAATPSRWTPINAARPRTLTSGSQAPRRGIGIGVGGAGAGAGVGASIGGPSGIQRPPFSIGPGESRGVICAVSGSNSVDREVGLAFVNIPIAEAVLTAVTDTQFYPRTVHKIQMMEASRVLMPPAPAAVTQSGLALRPHIEEELHGVPVFEMAKSDWSSTEGMQCIRRVVAPADLPCLEFAVKDNLRTLSAFAAAMKHIKEDFGFDFDSHSVRIRYQPPADVMMISLPTIRSLELIQNANNAHSKDCLFGLLNRTTTPMGARILRSNILQPSTQAAILNPRFEAVGELAQNDGLLTGVRHALQKIKPLGDIEHLLAKLVILPKDGSLYESEQAINNILKLKTFLALVPDVFSALSDAASALLVGIRSNCVPDLASEILEAITDTIDANATYATKPLELRNQRVHTVKHEISASLDIQRKLYEDFSGKIHDYVNDLEGQLRVKITVKYTAARKFYLQVRAADFGRQGPPAVLINRTRAKGNIECQTLQLVGYNERINQAVHGAMMESDEVIKGLLSDIRPQVSALFKYCESIALLDLVAAFATLARSFNYTRPFIQNDVYGLVAARHPILDSRGLSKCIPNDYFVTEETRFQIITGQNMSGKSTYLRAIAMLQIMAQIGCYVPAETARFPIVCSLFARASTDDLLEANLSTFSVEMREMAFILRNVNNKSLVIVDELGRATSTNDGLAIAAAMSEALLQSNATVFFATHFSDLAHGMATRIGVVNRHLQTETTTGPSSLSPVSQDVPVPVIRMLYHVTDGAETEVSYGITLAKAVGFPATFIARAEKVAAELHARARANRSDHHELEEARRRTLVAHLVRQLRLAQQSGADDEELWQYLKQIHDDFWTKMLAGTEGSGKGKGDVGGGSDGSAADAEEGLASSTAYAVKPLQGGNLLGDGLDLNSDSEIESADADTQADDTAMADDDDGGAGHIDDFGNGSGTEDMDFADVDDGDDMF